MAKRKNINETKEIKNKRRDIKVRSSIIIGLILSVLMVVASMFAIKNDGNSYGIDTKSEIKVSSYDEIIKKGSSICNDVILLTNDIKISDVNNSIGKEELPFNGTFDGQGHKIEITYNNFKNIKSIFEIIGENGIIKNVHFYFKKNITLDSGDFSGIADINNGIIENCIIDFSSISLKYSGSFSPTVNTNNGEIRNCLFKGIVYLGGLGSEQEKGINYSYCAVNNNKKIENVITEIDVISDNNIISDKNTLIKSISIFSDGKISGYIIFPTISNSNEGEIRIRKDFKDVYKSSVLFDELKFSKEVWQFDNSNNPILRIIG